MKALLKKLVFIEKLSSVLDTVYENRKVLKVFLHCKLSEELNTVTYIVVLCLLT